MTTWKRHEEALFPKRNNVAVGRSDRVTNKRDIEQPSLDEGYMLRRRRTVNELDRHIRVLLRIDLQKRPQKAPPNGWLDPDAQMPGPASACLSCHSGRTLKVRKGLPGFPDEAGARNRELETAATPLEQRYAERRLELPQAATNGGMSNTELLRGPPETQPISDNECPANRYGANRGRFRGSFGG